MCKNLYLVRTIERNAFGSFPHDALFQVCAACGLPAPFLDMLRFSYEGGRLELVGAPPGDAPIKEVVGSNRDALSADFS